jgi:hypothetical protein
MPKLDPAAANVGLAHHHNRCQQCPTKAGVCSHPRFSMFALPIRSLLRCSQPLKASSQLTLASTSSFTFVRKTPPPTAIFRPRGFGTSTITMASFDRLIRFETQEGKTLYGNLEKEVPTREIEGSSVDVLEGDVKSGFRKTGGRAKVGKVCLHFQFGSVRWERDV